jgi:predicted RNA-binding Zn ribbon-like protein
MQSLEELPFVAGHIALDFVNTAEERGHPDAGDVLRTPDDLRRWGQRYGVIGPVLKLDTDAEAEFDLALEVRETLYELFFARAHQQPVRKGDIARLTKPAIGAYEAATLQVENDGAVRWRWSRSKLATIRHVVVTSAIALVETPPSPRLKQCPGDRCGWFFLDTTKRGNRRWCVMSECGQEAKDERRRQRRNLQR